MVVLLGKCSQYGKVLLNLSSLLQCPTISKNCAATAGNEACLPKIWLQFPEDVTPGLPWPISWQSFPVTTRNTNALLYHFDRDKLTLINNLKIRNSVFNGVLPCIIWRWDTMRWWASIPESKGLWCLQEIRKPINGAFMLRLGSYDLDGSRFVWMVIEHGG